MSTYKQLISMDIDKCVNEIVEAMLPRFTKNKVFVVNLQFSAENYDTDHSVRENLTLIYYRPQNYTFVGTRIPIENEEKMFFFPDRIDSDLICHSYHDSCWRSDGTEHVIRKTADNILKKLHNNGKNYSIHTGFGITAFKLIEGSIEVNDSGNERSSRFYPINK